MIPHKWGIKTADLMVSDGGLETNTHHVILMRYGLVASFKCRRRENSICDHGCQCSRSEHPVCGYFYPPCSYLMLWLNQTILTVNSFVLSHYFTEAWCVNQTVSKGEKKRERERERERKHIFFKWRKIWAFYNKHIFQRMSFSQSNYFTSPQDYWLHHTEKLREACFIFPIYLWFLCKLILVTMKNDKFAIWSKC